MTVTAIDPDGLEGALATVADVRRACVDAGEPDPLDEATVRLLRRTDAVRLWVGGAGFATLHDGALDLAVAPPERERGHGTALADAAAAGGDVVSAWSHADHPGAAALAARLGLVRARELWVMRRPAALPLPALEVPAEVTVRSYRDADAAELLRVNAAAFAHHPEQGAMDAADLAARMAEPWYDPADLLVVSTGSTTEEGPLLAFHWTKRHPVEPGEAPRGEVYVVGVDPAAQGRGLGRLITLAGLHHLADRLPTGEVHLYVEADNTAARRLYEGLGFTHAARDTHVQYRRP